MIKHVCAALALLGFAASVHAAIIVDFRNETPVNGIVSPTVPTVEPAVITINIGPTGVATGSAVSGSASNSDQWTISGTASSGFNSTIVLSLTGENSAGPRAIEQRMGTPEGIGVNGNNQGKIDSSAGTAGEAINIAFDAIDAGLVGQQISLTAVGAVRINAIGTDVPDLGIIDFDGTSIVYPDIANVMGPTVPVVFPVTASAYLAGGSTGQISITQPDQPQGAATGFSLASIEFDVTPVPEPSNALLVAAGTLVGFGMRRNLLSGVRGLR